MADDCSNASSAFGTPWKESLLECCQEVRNGTFSETGTENKQTLIARGINFPLKLNVLYKFFRIDYAGNGHNTIMYWPTRVKWYHG